MGLFDIFKKKKEDTADVVESNGQVQVQPEGVQVVNNPVPQVETIPESAAVSAEVVPTNPISNDVVNSVTPVETIPTVNMPIPTPVEGMAIADSFGQVPVDMNIQNQQPAPTDVVAGITNLETPISDTVTGVVSEVNSASLVVDNSSIPESLIPVEENTSVPESIVPVEEKPVNMNEFVDSSNPSEVLEVNTEDEKKSSEDIVPAMEDVAALIDNPIPAKSEEENMSANPEELIVGGENSVEWQENPFKEETSNLEDNSNLLDNLVSDNENVISHNEPMDVQSIEPTQKEDEIQDLSLTLEMDSVQEETKEEVPEDNKADEVAELPVEDTVIRVDDEEDNQGLEIEQSNIFKEGITENNKVDDEFVPIVVDEHEDDEENIDNNIEDNNEGAFEEKVPTNTTDFVNLISEVTSITDESIPNSVEEVKELANEEQIENVDESLNKDNDSNNSEEEIVSSFEEDLAKENENEQVEAENEQVEEENLEDMKSEEETSDIPVIVEQEESNIFNIDDSEEDVREEVEEDKPKEEMISKVSEEEFEGPIIEEESTFSIFDLPPLPLEDVDEELEEESDEEDIVEEKKKDIFEKQDESIIDNDNIVIDDDDFEEVTDKKELEEEENEFEEDGPKKVEKVDDIGDMYSQLEFKNEKIRFCDNCGALILGDNATVCPSCGEPL